MEATENTEFEIKVREPRHAYTCECNACFERFERLSAYFAGKTEDRGFIPGSRTRGEPTRYRSKGRRIMGSDAIYTKIA